MALKTGDTVPKFTAKEASGAIFESDSVIGKKTVIIYFYPKDDTPQCTAQACGFRDNYAEFVDLGVEIIGVSSDDVNSHQEFIRKYNLPFLLLSDSDKALRKLFGVPSAFLGLLPGRVTYLLDKNGVIQMVFDSVLGMKHVKKMIEKLTE
ncbi:peroxiredoxin [Flavobacterium commune]|uniref:thioredoxin-dependent peroxiredoxin n=1 Tax=Flavobacterium commune TaxID=1306519 RepID=A0A1D9P8N3_9FLAO|nr:peroxiredoxin [Flavobacterium commune]AOZ98475.1 peroxiredoxin [Flavobacterium commune]